MTPHPSRMMSLTAAASFVLVACTAPTSPVEAQDQPTSAPTTAATTEPAPTGALAVAELARADAQPAGTSRVAQSAEGLDVTVSVMGMTPGTYGVHIHTTGKCDAPDFASAGGHWNPTAKQHGSDNPAGAHSGDLPNIVVAADGTGTITARVPGVITGEGGLLDADGAAVMVHAGPDDFRTDPSGNSGARIACGVLRTAG